jgi:bifunctional DNA-binding transcriptional regulator/antitoxin component of YhaV-PrlF toxin-antitoxin module
MRYTVQLRDRGTLTLPSAVRERYHYGPGDVFTLVDLEGTIVLVPKVPVVPKLAAEIEGLREAAGVSVEELLQVARAERHPDEPQ